MGNLFQWESKACRCFRDALEELPVKSGNQMSSQEWLGELPAEDAEHAVGCEACREALEEFAETQRALAGMTLPEAGPWFTGRVMAAIAAREKEEEIDGVWISVRRLAPRLVVLSAVLLVVGGSWSVQQTRKDRASLDRQDTDIVFDSTRTPTWYDDGMGTINEVRP